MAILTSDSCSPVAGLKTLLFLSDDPDIILLTAAPPDQHGFQHVNCKEREYWMKKMKDNLYLFNQDLLNEIKDWGTPNNCPLWWHSNLMVFI